MTGREFRAFLAWTDPCMTAFVLVRAGGRKHWEARDRRHRGQPDGCGGMGLRPGDEPHGWGESISSCRGMAAPDRTR